MFLLAASVKASVAFVLAQVLQMCQWKTSCKGYPGKTNVYFGCSALVEFWVVNCGSYPFKLLWVVCGLLVSLTTGYSMWCKPMSIIIPVTASNSAVVFLELLNNFMFSLELVFGKMRIVQFFGLIC